MPRRHRCSQETLPPSFPVDAGNPSVKDLALVRPAGLDCATGTGGWPSQHQRQILAAIFAQARLHAVHPLPIEWFLCFGDDVFLFHAAGYAVRGRSSSSSFPTDALEAENNQLILLTSEFR